MNWRRVCTYDCWGGDRICKKNDSSSSNHKVKKKDFIGIRCMRRLPRSLSSIVCPLPPETFHTSAP